MLRFERILRTAADNGIRHGREAALHLLKEVLHLRGAARISAAGNQALKNGIDGAALTKMVRSCVDCGASPPSSRAGVESACGTNEERDVA